MIQGHLGVKTNMAAEFLTFDRIALESYVIPHFWLIWMHWFHWYGYFCEWVSEGRGPRVVVSTAAFHARVRGSVPGLDGLKETKKCLFPIHVWKSVLWGASVTER